MNKNKIKILSFAGVVFGCLLLSFVILRKESGHSLWNNILDAVNLSSIPSEERNYNMGVHFLSVGKADCSYIKCGEANILIDAGDMEVSPNIVEYLNRRGIKRLDLVIATHPHRDHIGQMADIIDNFEIDCFIMSKVPRKAVKDSYIYKRMLKSLKKKNVKIKFANPGEKIRFNDLTVEILGPCKMYENINDNSVVAKLSYGSSRFLFMGDAEKVSEHDIIESKRDLRAEVLKIGHHGSTTSTTEEFLSEVQPEYALISSGPNKFGLPKQATIEKLNSLMIKIFRTDIMGDISFLTNGSGFKVITQQSLAA